MIKKDTIGPMVLALAALVAMPATAHAQVNPALIGEGAQLWGNHCGRCHNTRPPTERSDLEWTIIVKHMRARANLTRHQADAVLAYLQATNAAEQATSEPPERSVPSGKDQMSSASIPRSSAEPVRPDPEREEYHPRLAPPDTWIAYQQVESGRLDRAKRLYPPRNGVPYDRRQYADLRVPVPSSFSPTR